MPLLLCALGLLLLGGFAALIARGVPRLGAALGVAGAVTGCLAGLVPTVQVVLGWPASSVRVPWSVPYGAFFVELDALSGFFLLPVFGLSALAAIYGSGSMRARRGGAAVPVSWLFFNLLVASMALVVVARNGILLLMAWEVMALSSFFLVTLDDDEPSVRDAGWTYLVASHLGTAFLLALFVLLGRASGSLDFDRLAPTSSVGVLFVLAVVGFGTKAGFVPLHVWLPEAHPAAPSHVSAVMSGAMIKVGIYGLLRIVTLLGPLPAWCGWLLIAIGATSGTLGALCALAQHDLKRLLAYSSVENVGIVALGLGLGLVGLHAGAPAVAVLGFAGGLLHVLNHALFKGVLFLGAGAVLHASGTRRIDDLGGLLTRMPWTGATFLTGAVAISGLPPLNGFVGELLIYLGAFGAVGSPRTAAAAAAVAVIAGLALIGGLAAAGFARAFGVVFLGTPRSRHALDAHEPGLAMCGPMLLLAAGCVAIGVLSALLVPGLVPVLGAVSGLPTDAVRAALAQAVPSLRSVTACALGVAALGAGLAGLRARWLAGRRVAAGVTWACGYAQPSPRMQYTASSFAQPLTTLFGSVLGRRELEPGVRGLFPRAARFETDTPDVWRAHLYEPIFRAIGRGLSAFHWLQHGRVQLYVLYVALTLLVLLVWKLGAT